MRAVGLGAVLVVLYTGLISGADAVTKLIAGGYAAAQLYALSGLIVVALCLATGRGQGLGTSCPRAMALRSGATVLAAVSFFYAFRHLPLAEVFVFIGLMPLLAALMSGPVLGEPVRAAAWAALSLGFVGVLILFPAGPAEIGRGHVFAAAGAVAGTFSMVLARYIGRRERNALAQVLYPNLALFVVMGVILPFVWKPMPAADLAWVGFYAGLLFLARWVLVVALRLLPAHAATPLMNLQFVWMAALGWAAFGEMPAVTTALGAGVVIASGIYLIWEQMGPERPGLETSTHTGKALT